MYSTILDNKGIPANGQGGSMQFTVPAHYYHRDIIELVTDFIADGYESYTSLPKLDQQKIAAACINVLAEDAYCAFIDSPDFYKVLQHFHKFLVTGEREHAVEMAEQLAINSAEYFEYYMDLLFDEKIAEVA